MITSLKLQTLFFNCNDIDAMRAFYTDLLGLPESYYRNSEQHRCLAYQIQGTELVFMPAPEELSFQTDWARQAGYAGSESTAKSWLFTMSYADFETLSNRIRKSAIPVYDNPEECDVSQQLFIKDPMGMTIELSVA